MISIRVHTSFTLTGWELSIVLFSSAASAPVGRGQWGGIDHKTSPASSSSFPWGSPGRSRQMKATRPAAWPWSALGSPPAQNISTGTLLGCQNTCTGTHFSHLYLWSYSFNQLYLYNVCYNQEFFHVFKRTQSDPRTSNNGRKRDLRQVQARKYRATTSALRTWDIVISSSIHRNNSNSDNDVWKTSHLKSMIWITSCQSLKMHQNGHKFKVVYANLNLTCWNTI